MKGGGRINATRGRQLCAIGALNERNRGNMFERGVRVDGLWSGTLHVKPSAGQDHSNLEFSHVKQPQAKEKQVTSPHGDGGGHHEED